MKQIKESKPAKPKDVSEKEKYDAQMALYKLGLATKPQIREPEQKSSWGTLIAIRQ